MAQTVQILTAKRDGDDGLIATFSDGTTAGYVAEELLQLRPIRERVETKKTREAFKTSQATLQPQASVKRRRLGASRGVSK